MEHPGHLRWPCGLQPPLSQRQPDHWRGASLSWRARRSAAAQARRTRRAAASPPAPPLLPHLSRAAPRPAPPRRGRAKNCIRVARERVEKSLQYAFRDRKAKKREFRALWITRISAGTRQYGVGQRRAWWWLNEGLLPGFSETGQSTQAWVCPI